MGVTTTKTNKPFNPRGNDQSPLAYNKAAIYSGKALDFDGVNDYVDLDGFTMAGTNATFIFTAKWNSISGLNYIFDLDPQRLVLGSQLGTEISIYDNVSWKKFADWDDTTNTNGYALTIEGTTAKLYLNGQPFGNTLTLGTTIDLSATTEFSIGSSQTKLASYFNGQISGTKLFNTALTAAQVADLYNNPEKICPTGVDNTALKLWLPMQEGAGTTAYDGSGNGNHGTISGATHTHGIGAPVAQTAVIDWNKGVNKLINSTNLNTSWNYNETSVDSGYSAPDGSNTAFKITKNVGAVSPYAVQSSMTEGDDYRAIYARTTSGTGFANLLAYGANTNNFFTITEEWQKFSIDAVTTAAAEGNFYLVDFRFNTSLDEIILWAPHCADSESVYIPTLSTAQPSPVLLPQGLTTGRDITGVNLFENVRKQGALNLDGNSWAEVHDNASLDIVDEVTLELWYYHKETSNIEQLIGKRKNGDIDWLRIYSASANTVKLERGPSGASSGNFAITENAWNHITATIDSSDNMKFYIGGVQVGSASSFAPWGLNTTGVLSIGAWINNGSVTTNSIALGQIAQPRIYNRALTAEEVQRNYDAGKNIYS